MLAPKAVRHKKKMAMTTKREKNGEIVLILMLTRWGEDFRKRDEKGFSKSIYEQGQYIIIKFWIKM